MLLKRYAVIATTADKRNKYLVIHLFSQPRSVTLIQRFSNSQKAKSTTFSARTRCLVCPVSPCSHSIFNNSVLVPYVVGMNPNSPRNPHSAMASGGNDIANINTSPLAEAYTLYGAVVGGPDKRDKYHDLRDDWPQTEVRFLSVISIAHRSPNPTPQVALDYNAPLLTLAAMHVVNDTADPFYTSLKAGAYASKKPAGHPCDPVYDCTPSLSQGAKIALGVIITVVGLVIVGGIIYMIVRFRRSRPPPTPITKV